jgi:D-sedoheptulose 7-phosphate isomerase
MTGPEGRAWAHEQLIASQEAVAALADDGCVEAMLGLVDVIVTSLRNGGKVMLCGNGGSAADAQHWAAELVGRQNIERGPAAAIALTPDSSVLTAVGNDYGYAEIFRRQVGALGRPGDVLVCISTSGRSANVVAALEEATGRGIVTAAITGREARQLAGADVVVAVPADDTPRVQELHAVVGHVVFGLVERALFGPGG